MGKSGCRRQTCSKSRPRSRCSHNGARLPGWPRGNSSARAAFCRKRRANSGAVGQFVEDQAFHVLRRQPVEQIEYRLVGIGQADEDAVVMVQTLRLVAEALRVTAPPAPAAATGAAASRAD